MDLKLALQAEFVRRCKANRAYSLRAFARFLEMDQSLLSKIMRDERRLSAQAAERVCAKLGLSERLGAGAQIGSRRAVAGLVGEGQVGAPSKNTKRPAELNFLPLPEDEFNAIAEWYHFAIIELFKTKGFKFSPQAVARRLGLHVEEVRAAIDRLTRLGMIRVEKGKTSVNARNNTWSNTKTTSEARKLLQKQLLGMGIEAIENIPFEQRDSGSLTVAIDKRKLPEFKERLRQIRLELGEYFQPSGEGDVDEVYQLVVSFFPLTK